MRDLVLIPGLGSDAGPSLAPWTVWMGRTLQRWRDAAGRSLAGDGSAHSCRCARYLRAVLAGVSMGGMVALEIIRAEPHRVIGLAIIDSDAFFS